jgi:hypothetical protein
MSIRVTSQIRTPDGKLVKFSSTEEAGTRHSIAIDVGEGAIDRGTSLTFGFTRVALGNPANENGKLTSIELWFATIAENVKVGTFSKSGDIFTPRDSVTIGTVAAGTKQTFSDLDMDVVSGDYIGIYYSAGAMEHHATGGSGSYYKAGDQFGAGAQTYAAQPDPAGVFSLYGIGST